jgi:ubiquinone/menaquinone biosynthesis C-methylase UbiE
MNPDHDPLYFLELQTRTGWGQILASFARWCDPQSGQQTLDVGCGPNLISALFSQQGALACGIDRDPEMLRRALVPGINAAASRLPFESSTFDLVTASNVLYLSPDPFPVLAEMVRVLRPGGNLEPQFASGIFSV